MKFITFALRHNIDMFRLAPAFAVASWLLNITLIIFIPYIWVPVMCACVAYSYSFFKKCNQFNAVSALLK